MITAVKLPPLANVRLPVLRMPVVLAGRAGIDDPAVLSVTAPLIVPVPHSVPPELTATAMRRRSEPLTNRVPPVTVVRNGIRTGAA